MVTIKYQPDIKAMLKNKSHSGSSIKVVNEFVYKTGGKRLYNQTNKQNTYFSQHAKHCHCKTVPVIEIMQDDEKNTEEQIVIKMPYIHGFSISELLLPEPGIINQWAKSILNFLTFVLDQSSNIEFGEIKHQFESKLQHLRAHISDPVYEKISSVLHKVPLSTLVPVGFCHGDLNYLNMLVTSSNDIYLLDFLDTFLESPLQDFSKLRQDLLYNVCEHLDSSYCKVELRIVNEIILSKLYQQWSHIWDSELLQLFDMFTLIRIIPYYTDIKSHLEECVLEMDKFQMREAAVTSLNKHVLRETPSHEKRHWTTLIVPAAGNSSRFPSTRPKWLLTQPNSKLMIEDAINKLDLTSVSEIIITILQEHLDRHCGGDICWFPTKIKTIPVRICILLESTRDQVETIVQTINRMNIRGPIFCKDCDNQFSVNVIAGNYTCTSRISSITRDLDAKSFVSTDRNGMITQMSEKKIISQNFNCGGYSFESSVQFLWAVEILRKLTENQKTHLNVSHVIQMLLNNGVFFAEKTTKNYEDWGTYDTWMKYRSKYKSLFLDIDGVLVKNGNRFWQPKWGETHPLQKNMDFLKKLYNTGCYKFILCTARTEDFKQVTEHQLQQFDFPFDQIVYNVGHCQRILVNDFSAQTNPFPSAKSISLKRNSDELELYQHELI